jgi:hypothetical protein
MSEEHANAHFDDEIEQYLEHFDHQVQYNTHYGINEQLNPDTHTCTHVMTTPLRKTGLHMIIFFTSKCCRSIVFVA